VEKKYSLFNKMTSDSQLRDFLKYKSLSLSQLKIQAQKLGIKTSSRDTKSSLYSRMRPKIVAFFKSEARRKGVEIHGNMTLDKMYERIRSGGRHSPRRHSPRRHSHKKSPHRAQGSRHQTAAKELVTTCGKQCFADSKLKFNICPFCSATHCKCYPECDGLYAAYTNGYNKNLMIGYGDLLKCDWTKRIPTSTTKKESKSSLERNFSPGKSPKVPSKEPQEPKKPQELKKPTGSKERNVAAPGKTPKNPQQVPDGILGKEGLRNRHQTVDFSPYSVGDELQILYNNQGKKELADSLVVKISRRSMKVQRIDNNTFWRILSTAPIVKVIKRAEI
jgi:hypothetical protein